MKKGDQERLVLLDAHALLHRAYHALPEFANSQGIPTGGLYGFLSMILRIISDMNPDYLIACYDLPEKTFRHEAYEDYKGKRAKTDDALVEQIQRSRELCEKLAIPIYDKPGFEADDMLGTIVEETKKNKSLEIIIATGDMDTLQLVEKNRVKVFTLKKGMNDTVLYDVSAVHERFGFGPEQMADFKGLRGDPSDNIIGVPGIGEKTATELITQFGSIENLYKKLHQDQSLVKERIAKLLLEHEEGAIFSKTLATIRRDAPIHFELPEKKWRDTVSLEQILPLLQELEFKSLIVRLKELLSGVSAKEEIVQEIPKETQIALWLLNSENTSPTLDDVFTYAKTKNISEAQAYLEREIKNQNLEFMYRNVEIPLIPILKKMQQRGVLLDVVFLKEYSKELHGLLKESEKKIYGYVGHEFNINSPKQLGEVLFAEMQIHTGIKGFRIKKTASGTYSTRESDLEKLQDTHPIIKEIFAYRELQKLLSTYIDNLPEMVDAENRIHPELLQMGSATGRFACQNPNIQNIPIRGEQGKKIRNAFIAPPGHTLIAADYSQIELRCAAILSGDPVFLETFRSGKDVHASVAARVFHVAESEVTGDMRRKAKVINFGILYGMGVTALQKNLGTDRKEAQAFYDEYFKQLPKLSEYINETITQAKKLGYTETLFGRRRYFPGLKSGIPFIKAMAERAASNAPIQGTAADIIKLAMIHLDKKLDQKIKMVMQIHDEIVFEVPDDMLQEAKKIIQEIMEQVLETVPQVINNKVPINVSVASGATWGEAKD